MPRRKELSNVASGLYGSFISRNNDVAGYWGIGKLCLFAQKSETSTVRLNLLARTVSPDSPEFLKLVAGYHSFLRKHLVAHSIPMSWVVSAVIEIDFAPKDSLKKQIYIVSLGKLFKLSVVITDDHNKAHSVSGYSYCRPHDPRKEFKSVGSNRF